MSCRPIDQDWRSSRDESLDEPFIPSLERPEEPLIPEF
jgi:hypothetical protein